MAGAGTVALAGLGGFPAGRPGSRVTASETPHPATGIYPPHRCVLDPSHGGVTYNAMASSRTASIRAAKFRDRQRAKGLRPATIWIPDIRDPAYRARLDAACRELAALPPAEAEADAAAGLANAFKYMSGWQ